MFFAFNLAFSALESDILFTTNPSPLHSEQIPEPPQSSQGRVGVALAASTDLVLLAKRVAAAPTTVAATATEAAVSGNPFGIRVSFGFVGNKMYELLWNVLWSLNLHPLPVS